MKRFLLLLATLVFVVACAPVAQQATPDGAGKDAPLENTYWKLTQLGNAAVRPAPNQQEAHFILHPGDRRVSGSGGCNRLTGTYELEGDRLTFGRMAGTLMACVAGMVNEQRFLGVLQETRRAKITQQQLELLDESGRVVARFEAVHLK
jgi:heat shock protein HslJ